MRPIVLARTCIALGAAIAASISFKLFQQVNPGLSLRAELRRTPVKPLEGDNVSFGQAIGELMPSVEEKLRKNIAVYFAPESLRNKTVDRLYSTHARADDMLLALGEIYDAKIFELDSATIVFVEK